jgi:6-phosphogluconolactonase
VTEAPPGREVEVVVVPDERAAAREAAERLARAAGEGAHVALSGGGTVGPAYELAAELQPDWSEATVWWGDERAVPPDDERSNYGLARRTLLDRVEHAPAAVHRIRGDLGAEAAALEYDRLLEGVELGLALNGIGPDGHTASLFPFAPALAERRRRAVAAEPKLEPLVPRVTLTPPMFATASVLVYLAGGEAKAEAVRRAFAEAPGPATPASVVRGRRTVAILDEAAAALL